MAAAAILDCKNYIFLTDRTVKKVYLRHFAKFRQNRSNRGRDTSIFRSFKSWIFKILTVGKVKRIELHHQSSCQILLKLLEPWLRYGNFSIFPTWRPSAILDLWCVCWDHTRRTYGCLYHCAKFNWNPCSSFDNMHVFRFRKFAGKRLFTTWKGVFGRVWPLKLWAIQKKTKKIHPCASLRRLSYHAWKSVDVPDL